MIDCSIGIRNTKARMACVVKRNRSTVTKTKVQRLVKKTDSHKQQSLQKAIFDKENASVHHIKVTISTTYSVH